MNTKTHLVLDLVYHEDECNTCYAGTYEECRDWIASQGGSSFTYKIVPMTKMEMALYNYKTNKQ